MTSWFLSGVEPQSGQYRYTVKEKEDGTPWIDCEPAGHTLKIVGTKGNDLSIGFTLLPGATVEDAHKLAMHMNAVIVDTVLYQTG